MIARVALGATGVALTTYGVLLLLTRQDSGRVVDALVWLAGGVVVHDGILVPFTLLLAVLAMRLLPDSYRAPATIALVVVGPLTLLSVPVLGSFGARPDNATLLDRPYLVSWVCLLAFSVVAVAVAGRVVRSRHGADRRNERWGGGNDGTGAGGR